MSTLISTSEAPEQMVNVTELLSELYKLYTEQEIYNILRTQFIDTSDVDQFMADLSVKDGKYKDLNSLQVGLLTDTLTGFKTYLFEYLQGSGRRIQKMQERNKANAVELAEHAGETEVEEKLLKTRGRISKAMRFVNKSINGKSLKDVIASVKDKHELSPEQAALLLKTLQGRFENKENIKRRKGLEWIRWIRVQTKLATIPEKLWSLNEMERTGGEPDVMGWDEKTGEYIFMDCSAESPAGRRNCVYDEEAERYLKKNHPSEKCNSNAESMAVLMGIEILNEKEYRELRSKGEFDQNSWNWIKTRIDKRKRSVALNGGRGLGDVDVCEDFADHPKAIRAFRGSLRV